MLRSVLVSFLFVSPSARAVVFTGNPNVGFRVDRPQGDYLEGSVGLDKLRVVHCGGGSTDYAVGQTIDPVAGFSVAIDAGDHCGLVFFWDTDLDIDGDGSQGAFTVRATEDTTSVTIAEPISPVAFSPWSVVSGSMSGGGPWLLVAIE